MSRLDGSSRRLCLRIRAEALDISIAILMAILLVTFSATNQERPTVASTAPAIQVATPAASEVQSEQHLESTAGSLHGEFSEDNYQFSREDHPGDPPRSTADNVDGEMADAKASTSSISTSSISTSEPTMQAVDQYLWGVYQRSPVKRDSSGDFTWKDLAAAARLGMPLADYVIGGMDPDLRELLYRAGLAMDAAGIRWTILSAFRDDYRQGLASGYKASTHNSLHGGSAATGGYGHGCAVDIVDADGNSDLLWKWIDANSIRLGIQRLLPGVDPAHVQPRGAWHELALALRDDRLANKTEYMDRGSTSAPLTTVSISSLSLSAADYTCIGLRHRQDDTSQALADRSPMLRGFRAARARRAGTLLIAGTKWRARSGIRSAALALASHKSKAERATADARADGGKLPAHMKATARLYLRHAAHGASHNRSTI